MVQVPSGFCTLVVPCVGVLPEGQTGLPDSKVGRSMVGRGLNTCILTGFIVGMKFWFEICEYGFNVPCPSFYVRLRQQRSWRIASRHLAAHHDATTLAQRDT